MVLYGGLQVGMIRLVSRKSGTHVWQAVCECGKSLWVNEKEISGQPLSGETYHCGCETVPRNVSRGAVVYKPILKPAPKVIEKPVESVKAEVGYEPVVNFVEPGMVTEMVAILTPEPVYRTDVPGPAMCFKRRVKRRTVQCHDDLVCWLYDLYRSSAEKRKKAFALSLAEFAGLIQQPCHYCGTNPRSVKEWNGFRLVYNGIDRQDNARGYEMGNCVPCCKLCNMAKHQLSVAEFTAHVRRIVDHLDTL